MENSINFYYLLLLFLFNGGGDCEGDSVNLTKNKYLNL